MCWSSLLFSPHKGISSDTIRGHVYRFETDTIESSVIELTLVAAENDSVLLDRYLLLAGVDLQRTR